MNTFFFGYLPIKIRRILRSLLIIGLVYLLVILSIAIYPHDILIIIIGYIVLNPIVSYILEPFISKQ